MKVDEETAIKVAEFLLQIKAIKLNITNPFTWASGLKSPIYCDNRITLSYPKIRTFIRQEFVKLINEEFGSADIIAAVATGGITQGALVSQDLGLPFAYVRPSGKKHGLTNKIEGIVEPGQTVIVIEDLVSTGKSSLKAVKTLRHAGCFVKGMIAIFTYGLKISEENFQKNHCPLITLTDYDTLIKKALENDYIKETELKSLIKWHENPLEWSNNN